VYPPATPWWLHGMVAHFSMLVGVKIVRPGAMTDPSAENAIHRVPLHRITLHVSVSDR
jgi:hypothetical protein